MIAITGTSGFIGKHLLNKLIGVYGKEQVLAITSKPINECPYLLHNDYQIDNDFFGKAGYTNITTLIHAGAFTPKNTQQANLISSCNDNIRTTDTLLNNLPASVNNIIYLSTLDVYSSVYGFISESSLISPISLYGASKFYCEKMMRCWAEEHSSLFKVLRIGHTYGPGEEAYQKIIPQTMKQLMNGGAPIVWGSGNDLRSFIYIDDVVDAILNAVVTNENLPAINIVGKNAIAIKDLVKLIVEISQKNTNVEFLSNNVPQRDLLFDNSLMVSLLGAEKTSLREGLIAEWNYLIAKKA